MAKQKEPHDRPHKSGTGRHEHERRSALASIESGLTEAAADLGAPPRRVTTAVVLPIARPAIAAAAAVAFIVALGEFGAAAFLATPDRPTVPVAIARLLGQPGSASLGQAAAMSVLLMVVTAAGALAIDRSGGRVRGCRARSGPSGAVG